MEFTKEEVEVACAIALNNYKKDGVVLAFQVAAFVVMTAPSVGEAWKWMTDLTAKLTKEADEEHTSITQLPGYKTYAEKMNTLLFTHAG